MTPSTVNLGNSGSIIRSYRVFSINTRVEGRGLRGLTVSCLS